MCFERLMWAISPYIRCMPNTRYILCSRYKLQMSRDSGPFHEPGTAATGMSCAGLRLWTYVRTAGNEDDPKCRVLLGVGVRPMS